MTADHYGILLLIAICAAVATIAYAATKAAREDRNQSTPPQGEDRAEDPDTIRP